MVDGPLLAAEEFTIRTPLFRAGVLAFLAGAVGGLLLDSNQHNWLAVGFDVATLSVLLAVAVSVWRWNLERGQAVAILIYTGALNFALALVQTLLLRPETLVVSVYNNLFILSLFLGVSTFLIGRLAPLIFGMGLFAVLLFTGLAFGDNRVRDNLWLEVPAVLGSTFLLFQYRAALDRLLANLQNVIRENRALRDRERLAALGEMTAGIAHEIKNPLNFVVNFAESSQELLRDLEEVLARLDPTEDDREERLFLLRELRQNLEDIRSQGLRGAATVQGMLLQARSSTHEYQAVELNELVGECLHLAWAGHRVPHGREAFEPAPEPVVVKGSRPDLSRAFLNLISNALWSVTERQKREGAGYQPRVTVRVTAGDWAQVSIEDNGVGLSAHVKSQLFVPFFTTKPAGEGTGLGLTLTREVIVDEHGGKLGAEGDPGWARFNVVLPLLGGAS